MSSELVKEAILQVKTNWYSPRAGLIVAAATLVLGGLILSKIELAEITWTEYTILAIAVLFVTGGWFQLTRLPKTPRGTIGILVCIETEQRDHYRQLKSDLLLKLQSLLKASPRFHTYTFLDLPEYHCRKLLSEPTPHRYRIKTRALFVLYGRGKVRRINKVEHHILELNCAVGIPELEETVTKRFADEFLGIMPAKITIQREIDLLGFEVTAQWLAVVAEYMIGTAALMAYDLDFAEHSLEAVHAKAKGAPELPAITKIRKHVPMRLSEVYTLQCDRAYQRWRQARGENDIGAITEYLDKQSRVDPENYNGHLMRALVLFVKGRQVDAAIAEIRRCQAQRVADRSWQYSLAFLLAYRGELQQARKQYQKAQEGQIPSRTVLRIEDFIEWVLEEEPEKVQLHFCLAMVNDGQKGDRKRALEEFEAFVESGRSIRSFRNAIGFSLGRIRQLRGKLNQRSNTRPEGP